MIPFPIDVTVSGEQKPAPPGGLFFALILAWLSLVPATATAKLPEVVVASYNVENYHLEGSPRVRTKTTASRDAVADVAAEVHPDILGLCEMGSIEALKDLQERLKLRTLDLPFIHYVDGPDPDRHLALLSRFPIHRQQSLANVPFQLNGMPEHVRRGFLDVTVEISPTYQLRLIGVHLKSKLASPSGEALLRRMEAQLLRQHIDQILAQNPAVNLLVYGDFNDTKDESSVRAVLGARDSLYGLSDLPAQDPGGDRWTYYRFFTDVYERIDFLMVNRALRPEVVFGSARISQSPQWRKASDHRLLYASLIPVDKGF